MCEHGGRAFHNERHGRRNIRPKQLRNREVSWEGSHGSKLMSRRTERPYKVDGVGEHAPQGAAPCSTPEINGPVVQREFTFLLRETCNRGLPATAGAAASNGPRAGADLSGEGSRERNFASCESPQGERAGCERINSAEAVVPRATSREIPDGLTTREGLNLAGRTRPVVVLFPVLRSRQAEH